MTWLLDENITRPAYELFLKAGFTVKHLAYNLGISGVEDSEVLSIAIKNKKTLITADYTDFKKFTSSKIRKSYGVWIFYTKDYAKQVGLFKKALQLTRLKTLKQRKGKKVIIHNDYIEVTDCNTNTTITHSIK